MGKKIIYTEPAEYIPRDIREKLGIGEFSQSEAKKKVVKKKTSTPKKK